jgi:hypothetical protein
MDAGVIISIILVRVTVMIDAAVVLVDYTPTHWITVASITIVDVNQFNCCPLRYICRRLFGPRMDLDKVSAKREPCQYGLSYPARTFAKARLSRHLDSLEIEPPEHSE